MCLAAVGRVLEVDGVGIEAGAVIDLAGRTRSISLAMVPDARAGDWVRVHGGYAFEVMTRRDAMELLDLADEIGRHLGAGGY